MKCSKCQAEWTPGSSKSQLSTCPFCGASLISTVAMDENQTMTSVMVQIVEHFGEDILSQESKCLAAFKDFAPKLEKEQKILKIAYGEGVYNFFLGCPVAERESHMQKARQAISVLLSDEASLLVVNSFANALGWSIGSIEQEHGGLKKKASRTSPDKGSKSRASCFTSGNNHDTANDYRKEDEAFKLGEKYYYAHDYGEALKFYRKSAEDGIIDALYKIGRMYELGEGIPKADINEAIKWYREAAEAGDLQARNRLKDFGLSYGINQDATKKYRKADEAFKVGEQTEKHTTVSDRVIQIVSPPKHGRTTVVANLGVGLAARGKKVVLIDMDTGLRNLDLLLGLERRIVYTLVDVVQKRVNYGQALVRHKKYTNLFLLPTSQVADNSTIEPKQMAELIQAMSNEFDYILIDCSADIEQGVNTAIPGAGKAIVVTLPEISAVRDVDKIIGHLQAANKDIKLIVNCIRPQMVKDGTMLDMASIDDILSVPCIGQVPYDEKVVDSANRGVPVLEWKDSKAGEAFRNIVGRLCGENVPFMEIPKEKSFCYITTAVCESLDKPDDCYELTMFRKFRDSWLMMQPDGEALIREYYAVAPTIVQRIDSLSNANEIYQDIMTKYLKPCLHMIEQNDMEGCKKMYMKMVSELK